MKKIIASILALFLMLIYTSACFIANTEPEDTPPPEDVSTPQPEEEPTPPPADEPAEAFPGKIAIVTLTADQNEEEYRSAEAIQHKYGLDKVIHATWPVDSENEIEEMAALLCGIAENHDVGAIIISRAIDNTNAAIQEVRATRGDDIFIVIASPSENQPDIADSVDLVLDTNYPIVEESFIAQAVEMGVETIVHYSFQGTVRLSVPHFEMRTETLSLFAEAAGLGFVELIAPYNASDVEMTETKMFFEHDIPMQIELYGKNTAFFGANCMMQDMIIRMVAETGAMYIQPCFPSPYHGFPTAFGVIDKLPSGEFNEDGSEIMYLRDIGSVIKAIQSYIHARDLSCRLANQAAPSGMLWTTIGAEYAILWINGEAPQGIGEVDIDLLHRLTEDYIESLYGTRIGISLEPLTVIEANEAIEEMSETTYGNYILGVIDYIEY